MSFLLGFIPSWFWFALAAVAAAIVVGWFKGDWKWAFGFLAGGVLLYLQSRAYQSGKADAEQRQEDADNKARDTIATNKTDVAGMNATDRDKEFDEWSKH